jgi:hypothetical protein
VIPRDRRPVRGRVLVLALGAALTVAMVAAGAVWASSRQAPADRNTAGARPATPTLTAARAPADPSHPRPGSVSASVSAPSASATGAAAAADTVDWQHVLDTLDSARARAFAARDTALLAGVYVPGPLRRADASLLLRLVPAGCGLQGVRTAYSAVRVTSSGSRTVITATARLPVTRLTCHGRLRATARGTGPTTLRLELVRTGAGRRIAALTQVRST